MKIDIERYAKAEEWVIGAILNDPENFEKARFHLSSADFFHPTHKKIFQAMERLHREGIILDITTLGSLLQENEIEVSRFLKDDIPTGETLNYWAKVVKKNSLETRAREEMNREEISWRNIETISYELNTLKNNAPLYRHLKDVPQEDYYPLIKTGFPKIDRTIKFKRAHLLVIGGRTQEGKTSLALQMLVNMSQTVPAGVISMEMMHRQVEERVRLQFGKVPQSNFFIADPSVISTLQLKHIAKGMRDEQGVQVIVIDYLQKIREKEDFTSKHLEISFIINRIQELAKELRIGFIVISTVSRGDEKIKPTLSLLKESGDIEYAADSVLLIHTTKEEKQKEIDTDCCQKIFIIAKNRYGSGGEITIDWKSKQTRYYPIEPQEKFEYERPTENQEY
jgi:replicative DNA helicase